MLARRRSQYHAIFEPPVDAVLVVDADGTIVSADPGVEPMFGYFPNEIIGQNLEKMVPDQRAFASLSRGRRGPPKTGRFATASREIEGRRKDGAAIALDLSISQWSRGGETFFTGVMRYARERGEGALDPATRRLLANLYRQSGAGLAATDREDRFVSVNQRYCDIVGRSQADLIGMRMLDVIHPDDRDRSLPRIDRLGGTGGTQSTDERYIRGDGSTVWVTATANLIPSHTGAPLCLLVVIDVTEPRRAQAALRSAEDRLRTLQVDFAHLSRVSDLGEMAAAIAHEVNQPLAAISNYLNGGLLDVKSETPERSLAVAREAMTLAAEQGARAADIVRGLREFVMKGARTRQTEAPEALIESALSLALIDLCGEGIALDRRPYEGDGTVEVDPTQIQQVFVNLLRNAVDVLCFNPAGKERRLTVAVRDLACEGVVEFCVADTGSGIPAELCDRLFDPFVTSKTSGMGMGLAVCRRIVEAHQGSIEVDCGVGVGATFLVRLPRSKIVLSG